MSTRIIIRPDYSRSYGWCIWFAEYRQDGTSRFAKPIHFEMDDKEHNWQLPEPTLSISGPQGMEFFKAMIEAMQENGLLTDRDENMRKMIEGKDKHIEHLNKLANGILEKVK